MKLFFTKPWEEICQGREEYKQNLANTAIPADLQDLLSEAIMHTPRRPEINRKIQEELESTPPPPGVGASAGPPEA